MMEAKGIDLYMTSSAENIFYLSGQQTPGYYTFQCLCVPAVGELFHLVRGLEMLNARANTYFADIVGYDDGAIPALALANTLKQRGWAGKRIEIDKNAWFFTVNIYEQLMKECGPFEDGSGIVERLRRVKSENEIDFIEKAAAANDAGMAAGLAQVKRGASENDVAAAIMQASIAAGSEYVGMEPFVTSGPRSGIPLSTWRRRKIEEGDVVILETAACHNRYHAALYRTAFIGKVPAAAREMYQICEQALDAGLAKFRRGNTCADVHQAVHAVIDAAGYSAGFRKRSGYSIGISFAPDWGEGNILSLYEDVNVPLEPGMVFHIPITLREYAKFTVAASGTYVVTHDGHRGLSKLARKLNQI
jgi:Xaa-Pro dipeptidase